MITTDDLLARFYHSLEGYGSLLGNVRAERLVLFLLFSFPFLSSPLLSFPFLSFPFLSFFFFSFLLFLFILLYYFVLLYLVEQGVRQTGCYETNKTRHTDNHFWRTRRRRESYERNRREQRGRRGRGRKGKPRRKGSVWKENKQNQGTPLFLPFPILFPLPLFLSPPSPSLLLSFLPSRITRAREQRRRNIPPESSEKSAVLLVVKLPDGKQVRRKFRSSDTIQTVLDFVDCSQPEGEEIYEYAEDYVLVANFPRYSSWFFPSPPLVLFSSLSPPPLILSSLLPPPPFSYLFRKVFSMPSATLAEAGLSIPSTLFVETKS